jgi:hypothetical protein
VIHRGAVVGVAAAAAVASSERAYALVRATRPPVWICSAYMTWLSRYR